MTHIDYLKIETRYPLSEDSELHKFYEKVIRGNLRKVFSVEFLKRTAISNKVDFISDSLPIVTWNEIKEGEKHHISIIAFNKYRMYSSKFVYEMISRWLIPGKNVNIVLSFSVDFKLKDISEEEYILTEVVIELGNKQELALVRQNLPIIATEIRLGVVSLESSARILEIKGINARDKNSLVQEMISYLISKRPQDFDNNIFTEMQHYLVLCRDDFKEIRNARYMVKIICRQYFFRKLIRGKKEASNKRQIWVTLIRSKIRDTKGYRKVLGVLIGLNYLRENEIFSKRHIIKSLLSCMQDIRYVESSYMMNQRANEEACTFFVEIERLNGRQFSSEEIKLLQSKLPTDFKNRIEHLMHPIFMPRNEEEILRNILTLSNQLKFHKDIPQMIISFDDQSDMKMSFTIILLRVLKSNLPSIQEMFLRKDTYLEFLPERIKIVGNIRKKYTKEANVFHLSLKKGTFLRKDHSLDLYKARQAVVSELQNVIGEVRDYNGGMIAKENEVFFSLKELLLKDGPYDEILLENFFYSLSPVVMRSILEAETIKKLFLIFVGVFEEEQIRGENYLMKVIHDSETAYVFICATDKSFQLHIKQAIEKLNIERFQLASVSLNIEEISCLGYIYRRETVEKRKLFIDVIRQAIQNWYKSFSFV